MRMIFAVVCLAFAITGCASEVPSPLNADAIKSLQLTDVVVVVAPDANISWANAEHEFVVAHKASGAGLAKQPVVETGALGDPVSADASATSALVASSEGQAFVREKVAGCLKAALEATVKPALQSGARPVRLEITVHAFIIPSALQRATLGGIPVLEASATLKDLATGQSIASRPKATAAAGAGNGVLGVLVDQALSDLDVRLADVYAQQYRHWLFPNA